METGLEMGPCVAYFVLAHIKTICHKMMGSEPGIGYHKL